MNNSWKYGIYDDNDDRDAEPKTPLFIRDIDRLLCRMDPLAQNLTEICGLWQSIQNDLLDARNMGSFAIQIRDTDLERAEKWTAEEMQRIDEMAFYWRALQEYCSGAGITLPAFLVDGFNRVCDLQYKPAQSAEGTSADSGEELAASAGEAGETNAKDETDEDGEDSGEDDGNRFPWDDGDEELPFTDEDIMRRI